MSSQIASFACQTLKIGSVEGGIDSNKEGFDFTLVTIDAKNI